MQEALLITETGPTLVGLLCYLGETHALIMREDFSISIVAVGKLATAI